jgi:hypothetical protein
MYMHLGISLLSAPELVDLFIVLQHSVESVSFGSAVRHCTRTQLVLVTFLVNSMDEIDCAITWTVIVQDIMLSP